MIEEIKYYRRVISELMKDITLDDESKIRLKWESGNPERFKHQRNSHTYANKVHFNLLETRMQLGNLLKYLPDTPDPYREATKDRLSGKTGFIAEEVDNTEENFNLPEYDNKVDLLDYIRELLQEMQNRLADFRQTMPIHDPRSRIHMNEAISSLALARNYCGKILGCIRDIRKIDEAS